MKSLKRKLLSLTVILLFARIGPAQSSPQSDNLSATQPAAIDPTLWKKLLAIDQKAQNVHALSADFRQEKFTPLLKKPLVSTGTLRASGSSSLWITQQPAPTQMLVNDREVQIYYPAQATEEIYPIAGKLASLASSPLPRLETMRQFFSFQAVPVSDVDPNGNSSTEIALKLQPTDDQLRQHVSQVCVVLDQTDGLVKIAETTDPDGERTCLTFSNIRLNPTAAAVEHQSGEAKSAELKLDIPPGTAITHPMEGFGGGDPTPPHANASDTR